MVAQTRGCAQVAAVDVADDDWEYSCVLVEYVEPRGRLMRMRRAAGTAWTEVEAADAIKEYAASLQDVPGTVGPQPRGVSSGREMHT